MTSMRSFLVAREIVYQRVLCGFHMRHPGAKHSTRFMASPLYLLKMQLLSNVWVMTRREKTIVKKMAQIIALLYGPYFLRAQLSTPAPRLDLAFIYALMAYVWSSLRQRGRDL